MTILHVSDLHFEKHWFDWLLDKSPPHDLLVISGDLLDLNAATTQQNQIAWVLAWLNSYPRPLCVCSGNHDLQWFDAIECWAPAYWLRDRINPTLWTDGQRVTFDGLSILNIGCTTHPKGGVADVWVVHAPPTGTSVSRRNIGFESGDPELVASVDRYTPRLVLAGHVHDPVRWFHAAETTLYLNPGCDRGARFPNHIVVESGTLAAHRFTQNGAQIFERTRALPERRIQSPAQVLTPAA